MKEVSSGRDSWASLAILGGVLCVAALLDASPHSASLAGVEGPPCLLGTLLGERACPGCGLTRSAALVAQGDPAAAFAVHPAGILVILLCAAGVVTHLHILIRRRCGHAELRRLGRRLFVVGLAAGWLVRVV
ncbi:MAG: DUF2752 domain-containing protein [Planctomycetota bacterium]